MLPCGVIVVVMLVYGNWAIQMMLIEHSYALYDFLECHCLYEWTETCLPLCRKIHARGRETMKQLIVVNWIFLCNGANCE